LNLFWSYEGETLIGKAKIELNKIQIYCSASFSFHCAVVYRDSQIPKCLLILINNHVAQHLYMHNNQILVRFCNWNEFV